MRNILNAFCRRGLGGMAGNRGGLGATALLTFAHAGGVRGDIDRGRTGDRRRANADLCMAYGPGSLAVITPIVVASAGVLTGTLWGERLLFGLSPERLRRVVGIMIGILGLWLIFK